MAALRKLIKTLQDGKTADAEIWRQKGEQVRAFLSDASVLNSAMISLGWTPLKVSKLEVLDHSECRVAVQRFSYSPICTVESLRAKMLSRGDTIGVSELPLDNSLFVLFHGILPSGFGRLQDETASLLMIIRDSVGSATDLFPLYTQPSFVLVTKGTLVIEKYSSKIPPTVYLCVDVTDIQVLRQGGSPKPALELQLTKSDTFYFYPNYKRPVRIGIEREGAKYLQSIISGFFLAESSEPIPAYIRFTAGDLRFFHACRLNQLHIIKIPTRCVVKNSNEYIVEWDTSCRIQIASKNVELSLLDSLPNCTFATIPHILEAALQYCTESSVVPLVNFYRLKVVSKSIENVRFLSKDYQQDVFSGEFSNQHNTVLLLSSGDGTSAVYLTVHVVDTCFPLLGVYSNTYLSLYGLRMEVRQGKVVGVAGVGSMLKLETSPFPSPPVHVVETSPSSQKLTYLHDLFPSNQCKSFPQHSWVSVFPLKLFDLTLELSCSLCSKSRNSLICPFCNSKCILNGNCQVLLHDSTMEFFAVIDGAALILKLFDLEKEEQLVMEHLSLRSEPFAIFGNMLPPPARPENGDSKPRGSEWLEKHCYSGLWKRRLNVQIASLPSFLLHPPLFANDDAPAVISNPNILKVSSVKDLSGNLTLTLGLKWVKVVISDIRECEPTKEAFDLIFEIANATS